MADIEKNSVEHHNRGPLNNGAHTGPAQPAPQYLRTIANPAPLGLFSFASTTFILSLYNAQARHITTPNIVVGMALGVGGLAQLLAGMWEFATGNTFGATAFSSYGGFWLSYAAIQIPGSGILTAYGGANNHQLRDALAIYLTAWFIVTFLFLLASLRSNAGLVALFFFLDLTFLLLAIGDYQESIVVQRVGGGFGVVTAFIAYYVGAASLITSDTSYVSLPVGNLPKKTRTA